MKKKWIIPIAIAAISTSGCGKSVSYKEQVELSHEKIGTAKISMRLTGNCPWGESCGEFGYLPSYFSIQLIEPNELSDVQWKGIDHVPVFLGYINLDLYLVLFAKHCFGHKGNLIAAHPVFRWSGKDWKRVPHEAIPSGTQANLIYTNAIRRYDGWTLKLDDVHRILDEQLKGEYGRAAATLDFDKWYKLHFSQCAGQHDRF